MENWDEFIHNLVLRTMTEQQRKDFLKSGHIELNDSEKYTITAKSNILSEHDAKRPSKRAKQSKTA